MNKILNFCCLLVVLSGCVTQKQKKGDVEQSAFRSTLTFTTVKYIAVIPVEIDGEQKNLAFDTGADVSVVQRDTLKGATSKVGGATNRKMVMGSEIIGSLKIGDVNFRNTYAVNANLVGIKEQIPNFGGLIGTPIISKANWLFNYPTKQLTISNAPLADETFKSIKIKRKSGAPYTAINIEGKEYEAQIDLGSSSGISIPTGSALAAIVLKKHKLEDSERQIYTIGGFQTVKEKVGTLPNLKIGDIEFSNVSVSIKPSVGLRIGSRFFADYILCIDNIQGDFKVKMK